MYETTKFCYANSYDDIRQFAATVNSYHQKAPHASGA